MLETGGDIRDSLCATLINRETYLARLEGAAYHGSGLLRMPLQEILCFGTDSGQVSSDSWLKRDN